jgi:hypothetical protein
MTTSTNSVTGNENAVEGLAVDGRGVVGKSETNYGMRAHSAKSAGLRASSDEGRGAEGWSTKAEGVVGISTNGNGVWGQTEGAGTGVVGTSASGYGVYGKSVSNHGVWGESDKGSGAVGIAKLWHGVYGETHSTTGGAGVWGEHKSSGSGVVGKSASGVGVWGVSDAHEGVHAETHSATTAALAAYQMNPDSTSAALYAKHHGNGAAAVFDGNVHVSGDIILANADCAEDFNVSATASIEPGTVMVLGNEEVLLPSHRAYDKRVAGVISGAGNYKPGIILDKQDSQQRRLPVALLGKVFCKVDAQFGPIEVGDLLTTSPTAGHAMRVDDPLKAFGAVIGKALRPLTEGQGLIPILIALQ